MSRPRLKKLLAYTCLSVAGVVVLLCFQGRGPDTHTQVQFLYHSLLLIERGERIILLRGNDDTTVSLSTVSDGLRSTISQVAAGRVSVSDWQYCNITIQTQSAKIVLLTNIIIIWLVAGCRLKLETKVREV